MIISVPSWWNLSHNSFSSRWHSTSARLLLMLLLADDCVVMTSSLIVGESQAEVTSHTDSLVGLWSSSSESSLVLTASATENSVWTKLCKGTLKLNHQFVHAVLKLNRNASERHTGTFCKGGTPYRNFWRRSRRNAGLCVPPRRSAIVRVNSCSV